MIKEEKEKRVFKGCLLLMLLTTSMSELGLDRRVINSAAVKNLRMFRLRESTTLSSYSSIFIHFSDLTYHGCKDKN